MPVCCRSGERLKQNTEIQAREKPPQQRKRKPKRRSWKKKRRNLWKLEMKMRPKRLKRMQRQQPHPWKLILRIWMWWASLTSWILAMGCRSSTSSSMKTGLCCPHVTSFICLFIPSRRIWMTQTGPVLESPGGTIDEKQCLRFNCVSLGVLSLVCLRLLYISFVCVMCHFYLNSSNFNPLRRSTWLTTTPSTSRRPVVCSTPMKVQVFKFPPFFLPLDCLCETHKHLWFQEVFFNKTWGISPTFHPQRHGTFNSSALRSSKIYWMWSETPWAWTKNF